MGIHEQWEAEKASDWTVKPSTVKLEPIVKSQTIGKTLDEIEELDTDDEIDRVVSTWTDTDGIYADDVEKGNPYHDPKNGRFTTGPKGGNPMIRTAPPPKNTKIAYKVFVVKDGKLYPPMVANPDGQDTPVGVWLDASEGKMATDKDGNPITNTLGRNKVKAGGKGTQGGSGTLAYRPGWHLGELPIAEQFYTKDKTTGEKKQKKNFVWAECEIAADVDYQEKAMSYGYNKNGKFQHSLAGLPAIPKDGFYTYRTNPDPNTKPWYITGAMKVNRILTDAETNSILRAHGIEPMKRDGGELDLAALGITETNFVGKSASENVAKTFEEILKFNPYHDNQGRFTTADSATLFTYRTKDPAKQGLADNAREREKARTTAADAPQPKKIREIEDSIRNQDIETAAVVDKDGNTVFMKDGEEDRVRFTNEEGDLMRGNVLTHNHPSSSMLSPADVSCFVGNELEEIRATNREGITYSLKRNQNYTKFAGAILASDYDFEAYMAEVNAQRELDSKGYADKIISGQMSQQAANKEFTGIMTNQLTDWFRRHAPEYGVEFTIEKRNIQKSAGGTTFRKSASGGEIVLDKDFEASIKAAFNEWLRRNGIEPEEEPVKKEFSIFKTDEDKRLVFGWASIALTVDGEQLEDRQSDMIDPEDLEEAAYEYVLNFRDTGEEHIPTMRKKGKLVESCVLTAEKQKAMGIPEGTVPVGWWIGFKIHDDDAWNLVKSGHYKMFSIEGKANRIPIDKSDSVAKSFSDILKYNDNHDPDTGRFAPKGTGASASSSVTPEQRDKMKELLRGTSLFAPIRYRREIGMSDDEYNTLYEEIKGKPAPKARQTKPAEPKPESKPHKKQTEPEDPNDYRMSHRPDQCGAGYDLTSEGMMPKDFYEKPWQYANKNDPAARESFETLKQIRNKPEAEVTIYRASPKNEFNDGDWITLSPTYAERHKEHSSTASVKLEVHSMKVKAKDIAWAGDDINEFGYFPQKTLTKGETPLSRYDHIEEVSVAKTFDEIIEIVKYNPYHDARGRFTTGGAAGGTVVPYAGKSIITGHKTSEANVKKHVQQVRKECSNAYSAIKKEDVDIDKVKQRGGCDDAEAQACVKLADNIFAKASAAEPQITNDVVSAVAANSGQMYGLSHRMKQTTSMAGKISADAKEDGISIEAAASKIKDSVRYTAIFEDGDFVAGYNSVKSELEAKGYTETRCKNFFQMYSDGTSCQKAVQCVYTNKEGLSFELQFHTYSTQGAKNVNHPFYEEQRAATTTDRRKSQLNAAMTQISSYSAVPDGVLDIKAH